LTEYDFAVVNDKIEETGDLTEKSERERPATPYANESPTKESDTSGYNTVDRQFNTLEDEILSSLQEKPPSSIRIRTEKRVKVTKKKRKRKSENEINTTQIGPVVHPTSTSTQFAKNIPPAGSIANSETSAEGPGIFEKIFVPKPRSRSPQKRTKLDSIPVRKEIDLEILDAMRGDEFSHGDGPFRIEQNRTHNSIFPSQIVTFAGENRRLVKMVMIIWMTTAVFAFYWTHSKNQNELAIIKVDSCDEQTCDSVANSYCVALEHGFTCRCSPGKTIIPASSGPLLSKYN